MTTSRSTTVDRAVANLLWRRRHDLHWPLEHVATLAGLRPGQVLSMELVADDDALVYLICAALNLYMPAVVKTATENVMCDRMPAPWDEPIAPDPDGPFPF